LTRLLRDNASLVRQAYLEFDLEAIFDGEAYADFALLWHVAHRSRVEPRVPPDAEEGVAARADGSFIEAWTKAAAEEGTRARDRLRDGVQQAIEALGRGFLANSANHDLRSGLRSGELSTQDFYRELLRLVYRLIFLFVAEDRDLLLDPGASVEARRRYHGYYSTGRLRHLAERRKGSRHADLYTALGVVTAALGSDEGAPGLGLPALGGLLFGLSACPHLESASISNADLLDAVRKLATIEDRGVLRVVDYRNLGSEELGSIYESLLELHPEMDAVAGDFKLRTAPGHERKTTGSYYTPSSLISVLLDSGLDPVLERASAKPTKEEAEQSILELSVVDPAAGSGHFLVAAAHRIARRLASIRTGDDEPSPEAVRTALRDVIGHCLYAVDINPMAVELCKVSLWLEAIEPGKPLTFLDAHVKCGNSLLGATPQLVDRGIPDGAFTPLIGDDKGIAAALRGRNKEEREGQTAFFETPTDALVGALAGSMRAVDALPEETVGAVAAKAARHADVLASANNRRAHAAFDCWSAAFVVKKTPGTEITTSTVRAVGTDPSLVPPSTLALIQSATSEYAFFHWPVEFPAVFERGGFDLVVGNPPWDQLQLDPQEWFAERSPTVANAGTAAKRNALIASLEKSDADLWEEYQSALRMNEAVQHFIHRSGRFDLTARGRLNSAPLFSELMSSLVSARGRSAAIVPTGVATDSFTQAFFASLVSQRQLVSVLDFENRLGLFPDVDSRYRFCLITCCAPGENDKSPDFAFYLRQASDLLDEGRVFALSAEDIRLINPNTLTCPVFRSEADAILARSVYQRVPVLCRIAAAPDESPPSSNPWGYRGLLMFMANTASNLFRSKEDLNQDGWRLDGNTFAEGSEKFLPLYEGKMVWQFDHRYGGFESRSADSDNTQLPSVSESQHADPGFIPQPRHWIPAVEVHGRLKGKWNHEWFIAYRDITNATNERTVVATAIPHVAVANNLPIILSDQSPRLMGALLANLDSLVLDFLARQKIVGTHLNFYLLEQLPILAPAAFVGPALWDAQVSVASWMVPRVAELTFTAIDLRSWATDLGWDGPPFVWNPHRRAAIRSELDGAFFHLYGISRDDVEYILDTFPIARRNEEKMSGEFQSKRLILEAYDAIADAIASGTPYQTVLDPPPGDPRAAHAPQPGEQVGQWVEPIESPVRPTPGSTPKPTDDLRRSRPPQQSGPSEIAAPSWLAGLSTSGDDGWVGEGAIAPESIQVGERVRHRRFGLGEIVWVRVNGRSTTLVIRFDDGDRDIMFGLGLLDFARQSGS
jgi:hypothetical protein